MSLRPISPSDQPAKRPKLSTLPDAGPGGGPAEPVSWDRPMLAAS